MKIRIITHEIKYFGTPENYEVIDAVLVKKKESESVMLVMIVDENQKALTSNPRKENTMKKFFIITLLAVVLFASLTFAGPKDIEDAQLKYEALVARYNNAYQKLPELKALNEASQKLPELKALQDFIKELDQKGMTINREGKVVEKPKSAPVPKPETKK